MHDSKMIEKTERTFIINICHSERHGDATVVEQSRNIENTEN